MNRRGGEHSSLSRDDAASDLPLVLVQRPRRSPQSLAHFCLHANRSPPCLCVSAQRTVARRTALGGVDVWDGGQAPGCVFSRWVLGASASLGASSLCIRGGRVLSVDSTPDTSGGLFTIAYLARLSSQAKASLLACRSLCSFLVCSFRLRPLSSRLPFGFSVEPSVQIGDLPSSNAV